MKKFLFMLVCFAAILTGLCCVSCSKDDDGTNPLIGTWMSTYEDSYCGSVDTYVMFCENGTCYLIEDCKKHGLDVGKGKYVYNDKKHQITFSEGGISATIELISIDSNTAVFKFENESVERMKKVTSPYSVAQLDELISTSRDDEDDNGGSNSGDLTTLAKTTWTGRIVDEEGTLNCTISFSDDKNGVLYATGTNIMKDEDGSTYTANVEENTSLTYTFDGKKGTAVAGKISSKMTVMGYTVSRTENVDPKGATTNFEYNSAKGVIVIFDDNGNPQGEFVKATYKPLTFIDYEAGQAK